MCFYRKQISTALSDAEILNLLKYQGLQRLSKADNSALFIVSYAPAIPSEKWRCRSAAGGVLRRQAFFQCFKRPRLKLLTRAKQYNDHRGASRHFSFYNNIHIWG